MCYHESAPDREAGQKGKKMFDMQKIGRNISENRKSRNMTQMELADRMNVSYQAVSNWERGNSMPDIAKLPELAEIFGVTVDELLGMRNAALGKAVEGDLIESIREREVTAEEVGEIAPLLKPKQVEEVMQEGNQRDGDGFSYVLPLLPFASERFIRELAEEYSDRLIDFVPFMAEDDVGDIVLKKVKTESFDAVIQFFPFISYPALRTLAGQYPDRLVDLAPFMAEDDVGEIVFEKAKTDGIEAITNLLPFMTQEHVADLAGQYPENIAQLAPFMYEDDVNRFIQKLLKKNR